VNEKRKMKNVTVITVFTLSALLLALMTVPAMAATYTIDGKLTDWGLDDLYGYSNWDKPDLWKPDSPTAYYVVEDNIDTNTYPSHTDWSGYSVGGVHIYKDASSEGTFIEQKINGQYIQPCGGEMSDIEAMWFDSDANNAYFAFVTSVNQSWIGDLKIVLNGVPYGVVLQGNEDDLGKVYQGDSWIKTTNLLGPGWGVCDENADWRIDTSPGQCVYTGYKGTVVWNSTGLPQDNSWDYSTWGLGQFDGSNHIIEIRVPRAAIGSPTGGQLASLYATLFCSNDVIRIGEVKFNIPEFATVAVPVCMILGMFYFFRRKRQNEGE
jgi:hypothetical protein